MSFTPTQHPVSVNINPYTTINPNNTSYTSTLTDTLLLSGTNTTQLTSDGIIYNSNSVPWTTILFSTPTGSTGYTLETVLSNGNKAGTNIDMSNNSILNTNTLTSTNVETSYINPTHTGPLVIGNTNSTVRLYQSPPTGSTGTIVATCDFVNNAVNSSLNIIYSGNGTFSGNNTFTGSNTFTNVDNYFNYAPHSNQLPLDGFDLANKAYVDSITGNRSGNGVVLYLNYSQLSGGYGGLSTLVTTSAGTTTTTTGLTTTTTQEVAKFITDTNYPGITTLPVGIWTVYIWGSVTDTTGTLSYKTTLYKYSSGGVSTLLSYGLSNDIQATSSNIYTCQIPITTAETLLISDRIVILIEADATGVPDSAVLTTYFEGTKYSYSTSTIGIGQNLLASNNNWTGNNAYFNPVSLGAGIRDTTSSLGTDGQVLTSTATGISWANTSQLTDWIGSSTVNAQYAKLSGAVFSGNVSTSTGSFGTPTDPLVMQSGSTVNGTAVLSLNTYPIGYTGGIYSPVVTAGGTFTIPNNLTNNMVVSPSGSPASTYTIVTPIPYNGQIITILNKLSQSMIVSFNTYNGNGYGSTGITSLTLTTSGYITIQFDGSVWTILSWWSGSNIRVSNIEAANGGLSNSTLYSLQTSQTLSIGSNATRSGPISIGGGTGSTNPLNLNSTSNGLVTISSPTGSCIISCPITMGTAPTTGTQLGYAGITRMSNQAYTNRTGAGVYFLYLAQTSNTGGALVSNVTGVALAKFYNPGVYICNFTGRFYSASSANGGVVGRRQVGYQLTATSSQTISPLDVNIIYGYDVLPFTYNGSTYNTVEPACCSFPLVITQDATYFSLYMVFEITTSFTTGTFNMNMDSLTMTRIG